MIGGRIPDEFVLPSVLLSAFVCPSRFSFCNVDGDHILTCSIQLDDADRGLYECHRCAENTHSSKDSKGKWTKRNCKTSPHQSTYNYRCLLIYMCKRTNIHSHIITEKITRHSAVAKIEIVLMPFCESDERSKISK